MREGRNGFRWRAAALGGAAGVLTVVITCAIGAALMSRGLVQLKWMNYWSVGILIGTGAACTLAALLAGGGEGESALSAGGVLAVLLILNLVLCGGNVEGLGVTALALAGGSGAVMLLSLNRDSRSKSRRRRRKKS